MRIKAIIGVLILTVGYLVAAVGPAHAGTPTQTALSMSPNPGSYGQLVTFTATVTPSPSGGTVIFRDGLTALGSATVGHGGIARLSTAMLSVGNHAITAEFAGSGTFGASKSPSITQSVVKAASSTSVSATPNPLPLGSEVKITAQVTAGATGMVEFTENGALIASTSVNAEGRATLGVTFGVAGSRFVTAKYLGDGNFFGSQSSDITVTVLTPSSTSLTVSPSPVTWGASVSLTADVSPAAATGIVQFRRDDGTIYGTCTLSGGHCTLVTGGLPAGAVSLTALYTGDLVYGSSVSAAKTAVVQKAASTTTMSDADGTWGQPVVLSATLLPAAAGGVVQFSEGARILGSSPVNAGQANLSVSDLSVGSHTVTASYSGNGNVLASLATALVRIAPAPTTLSLTTTPNPASSGQPVTISAHVAPTSASGSVTLTDGGELVGACTLAQGTCTVTSRSLLVGEHTLTATYSGDAEHATSAATVSERVAALPTRATAKAVSRKSKLKVTVRPKCVAQYSFVVHRSGGGKWTPLAKTYRTTGPSSRVVNLPKGTYRAVVAEGCGRPGSTSNSVTLRR